MKTIRPVLFILLPLILLWACKRNPTNQSGGSNTYNDTMQYYINLMKGNYSLKSISVTPAISGTSYVYLDPCDSATEYNFIQPNPNWYELKTGGNDVNEFLHSTYTSGQTATGVDSINFRSPNCKIKRTKPFPPYQWSLSVLPDSLNPGFYLQNPAIGKNWKYSLSMVYNKESQYGNMALQHTTPDGHTYKIFLIYTGGNIGGN